MTNLEKYNNALTSTFGIDEGKLKGLEYQAIPEWDSVGHMELVTVIEDTFDIMMDTDDIVDLSSYERVGRQNMTLS